MDSDSRSEELGRILVKVQDDLHYLKTGLGEGHIDSDALDMVVSRAERGVQDVSEQLLASSNNHVVTLPVVSHRPQPVAADRHASKKPMEKLVVVSSKKSPLKEARLIARRQATHSKISPGQQVQVERISHLIAHPTHPLTKHILTSHYKLPPDKGQSSKEVRFVQGQVITGKTTETLTPLPRANRRDAMLSPPEIAESDAKRGLLSLLERGLIPPSADIVLSPPPIQPRPVPLHLMAEQHVRTKVAVGDTLATLKYDPDPPSGLASSIHLPITDDYCVSNVSTASKDACHVTVQTLSLPDRTMSTRPQIPPIIHVDYTDLDTYRVVIQNGCIVDTTKEYALLRRCLHSKWPHVKSVLHSIEELCSDYAVPLAVLDGRRLSALVFEYELGLYPSKQTIINSLLNREEVQEAIDIPGRRFKGRGGIHAAASKIQNAYRMFAQRRKYLDHKRKKWAAGVMGLAWMMFASIHKVQWQLRQSRASQLERYHERARSFKYKWSGLKDVRRSVIHLPSLGYSKSLRDKMEDFKTSQALQLARICDTRDPNVDVIYISPIPVDQTVLDYYHQLLSMGAGGQDAKDRVHIITPEYMDSFGHHHLSLATLLLYSPRALNRVCNLIKGKEAYIVPGVVSRDDIAVADKLGVPILGPDHEVTQLYSTRPEYKIIFNDASVASPPSVGNIFSSDQLVDILAGLIINHPLVTRWLFKLPDHIRGRGFAYCDVCQHLKCYRWLLKEVRRYGEKWSKRWAQESALKRVRLELPSILMRHAHPMDTTLFTSWVEFQVKFTSDGGLIEGTPPSESVTSLSVDMLIEPNGIISVVSMRDQILSSPYSVWGSSLPQCSVPSQLLTTTALRVGSECKARGVIGYLTVDFITFIHPTTFEQELWAVDLDLGFSDHLALQGLLTYATDGWLESNTGQLLVPSQSTNERMYAVLSPHLMHTNLSLLFYLIFFQMCKSRYIGFDRQSKEGTMFALVDGQHRERLGMVCVQSSLLKALQTCSANLTSIHQEVSTDQMPGVSNFQAASRELDSIIAELMDYNQTG